MRRRRVAIGAVAALVVLGLWLANASDLAPVDASARPRVLSHRGVHQTYDPRGVGSDTCTAARIRPPRHRYLENTLPSMRAAFAAGAEVVELDVHLTPDRVFAVFHDWRLDCRTNGAGVTERTPWPVLQTLDVAHGYTADGGRSFPLRGSGVGQMPRLEAVFDAFPGRRFLINFKSNRAEEGAALAALLGAYPRYRTQVFGVYGGGPPTGAAMAQAPGLRGYTRASLQRCLVPYLLIGWSGAVPGPCRGQIIAVPENLAWLLWGWPARFEKRMRQVGSDVILVGPLGGEGFTAGLDTPQAVARIPRRFTGYVWTNTVETTGPLIRDRRAGS